MIPDNNILDIILSTVLIYALLSILVSTLIEWWQHYKKTRATFLHTAINQLLNDPLNLDFGGLFYDHYLIDGMRNRAKKRLPAYISSTTFAQVLMEVIGSQHRRRISVKLKGGKQPANAAKQFEVVESPDTGKTPFELGLDALNPSPFSDTIRSYWERSDKDPEKMIGLLSRWYDDHMDRVGGWFKTGQRRTFLFFGFIVAIALNADSLHMIKMISVDDQLRARLVATAEKAANEYSRLSDSDKQTSDALYRTLRDIPSDTSQHLIKSRNATVDSLLRQLELNDPVSKQSMQRADSIYGIVTGLNIPIGWSKTTAPVTWYYNWSDRDSTFARTPGVLAYEVERNTPTFESIFMYVLGMIITGVMLSFGAPFWFETLVKVINIRRAGAKPAATNAK